MGGVADRVGPVGWAMRAAAACTWIVLTVLSLLPGEDRPHTGYSGNVEHVVAYAGAALITRLAFGRLWAGWPLLAFSSAAACFEIAQRSIPGRSPGVDNWAASSAGAVLGLVAARVLVRALGRWAARNGRPLSTSW